MSYTPPRDDTKAKESNDDDAPYDPEEAELSQSTPLPSNSATFNDLMDQLSKSSNPVEMTSSVLAAIAQSSNIEQQRKLLEHLTEKAIKIRDLIYFTYCISNTN